MADHLLSHRSGWSEAHHLGSDLRRHFGVAAPGSAVEAALSGRRRVDQRVRDEGRLWCPLRV